MADNSSNMRLTMQVDQYQKEIDELMSAHTGKQPEQPVKLQPIAAPLSPEFISNIRKQTAASMPTSPLSPQPGRPSSPLALMVETTQQPQQDVNQLQQQHLYEQQLMYQQMMFAQQQQYLAQQSQQKLPADPASAEAYAQQQQQQLQFLQQQQVYQQASMNRPSSPQLPTTLTRVPQSDPNNPQTTRQQRQSQSVPANPLQRPIAQSMPSSPLQPNQSNVPTKKRQPSSVTSDEQYSLHSQESKNQLVKPADSPSTLERPVRQPTPTKESISRSQTPVQEVRTAERPSRPSSPIQEGQLLQKISSEPAIRNKRVSEQVMSKSQKELPLRRNASLNDKSVDQKDFYSKKKISRSKHVVGDSNRNGIYARKKMVQQIKSGRQAQGEGEDDNQVEEVHSEDSDFGYYSYASDDEEARAVYKQTVNYQFYTYSDDEDAELEIDLAKLRMKETSSRKPTMVPIDFDIFVAADGTPLQQKKRKLKKAEAAKLDLEGKTLTPYELRKNNKKSAFLNPTPLDPRRVKGVHKGLYYRGKPVKHTNTADEKILQKYEGNGELDNLIPAPKPPKGKRNVPKALYDPKVRKQLAKVKTYYPYFTYFIILVNTIVIFYELIQSHSLTGSFISTDPFNIMIGPSAEVLVSMGARFVPCMKETKYQNISTFCYSSTTSSIVNATRVNNGSMVQCTFEDYCGLGGFGVAGVPNQWWRVITPIFMHGGIVHYLLNTVFFYQVGPPMEETYGTLKMAFIYMTSGIAGFLFAADLEVLSPVVGASGSIYGILAIVLLDLLLNFQLVENKWKELRGLVLQILFSLAFGLLPYIDNFAHIGGFITGILCGFVLMQSITISTFDKYGKLALRVFAVPCLVAFVAWLLYSFFGGQNASTCTWCKYLDCLPVNGWCDGYSQ